ncbi:ATPase subunit of ABC transporter with duplicated ATPase domains [Pseudomonas chlororaphis]|uniref:ABC-F family ATP-binding cassette domain-containing protein n=1 Tax=Pseudomonas chlororaphis TaxID=587753 RepID=UPI00209E7D3E|nr:ABC-F family ATP-binding cassette domain-containing protein [Pseudomonas chlororaphis]MCP1478396.1 ATPase subunit of ABC transporter with duplicated ATPase domains [Pseudomonas chlororaphis]MCP1595252.1 ATPase subunit of ABC transporter with duplicated ATPase domains [Pseudomonas chlororaphis]
MTHVTRLPALVSLNQLTFQFAHGETLFDSLDLTFDALPTGIVGRNGTGKSVLARLIAGELSPSSGSVTRFARVAYVAQEHLAQEGQSVAQVAGIAPALAALERLAAGQASMADLAQVDERWDLGERLRRLLDEAGLDRVGPDDPAARLSGGQRARIAVIGALLSDAQLLILDEPSNHLDEPGRQWLLAQLRQWRGGLLLISHDRQLLAQMQRIVELTPQGARVYGGNYAAFRAQREAEHGAAQAALEHARTERSREQKRLQREHDTIQRHAAGARRYADTANIASFERMKIKGAARDIMGHVRNRQQGHKDSLDQQVRDAYARLVPQAPTLVTLPGTAVPQGQQVFCLTQAQLPWLPPEAAASYLDLTVTGPMRIAVSGPNGCGKSTLLKMLAGEIQPLRGQCEVRVASACLDQRLSLLDPQRSILDHLGALDRPQQEGLLRSRLALLQLDAQRVTQPCGRLSGGERLKAALAIALWRDTPAKLLLLDEPTNHLDLESVEAFESALRDFPGAMLVVSHDREFLAAMAPSHRLQWTPAGWRLDEENQ